jgi:hypothetical protein
VSTLTRGSIFVTDIRFSGLVLGVSLAGSIGSIMGVYYTSPNNTVQKHMFWLVGIVTPNSLYITYLSDSSTIGLQRLPSSNIKPFVFPEPGHPFASCAVHMRRCWLTFLYRGYCNVSFQLSRIFMHLTYEL